MSESSLQVTMPLLYFRGLNNRLKRAGTEPAEGDGTIRHAIPLSSARRAGGADKVGPFPNLEEMAAVAMSLAIVRQTMLPLLLERNGELVQA